MSDPCPACGRADIKRRVLSNGVPHGKLRTRHKCPHGEWCSQGDRLVGSHSNGRAKCDLCNQAMGRPARSC